MAGVGVVDGLPLGRDSVSYRLLLEPGTLLLGGPRALLLQVAHEVVGAGVADHSDYERDPWTRLVRTLAVMTRLAHGTPEESAEMQRFLRRSHARINGTLADGSRYRALEPANMRWVWATLLDTLVTVHDRWVRRLQPSELDQLYEEWLLVAEGCGIPRATCPPDWPAFRAFVDDVVANELTATETARGVVAMLLRPPLPFPLSSVAGAALSVLVPAQLPGSVRRDLGLDGSKGAGRRVAAAARASRAVARIVPGPVRRLPGAAATAVTLRVPLQLGPNGRTGGTGPAEPAGAGG